MNRDARNKAAKGKAARDMAAKGRGVRGTSAGKAGQARRKAPVSPTAAAARPRARKHPAPPAPAARTITLRARSVMADKGYRSVSALQRGLLAMGIAISVPQLIRVVDGTTQHLNKEVIEGMLALFDCGIGDLFAVV